MTNRRTNPTEIYMMYFERVGDILLDAYRQVNGHSFSQSHFLLIYR